MEDFDKRTAQYIMLRDKIKELDDAHKLAMKPYKDALEKLENLFLQQLDATNSNSIKTAAGTFFKSLQASATIADSNEFQRFVIGGAHWELLDWRANKTAVQELVNASGAPPPGVNYSTHVKVNVRRASET